MKRLIIAAALAAAGCAGAGRDVVVQPAVSEQHIRKSATFKEHGDLTAAIEELKISLIMKPSNEDAAEELAFLMKRRDKEASEHHKKGLSLRDTDRNEAMREFLLALRINQDYQPAIDELRNLQLTGAEAKIKSRTVYTPDPTIAVPPPAAEPPEEAESYLKKATGLYEAGDYRGAIDELTREKAKHPGDREIDRMMILANQKLCVSLYEKKEYKESFDVYQKLKKSLDRADASMKKLRADIKGLAEELYKIGLKFYREQKLHEAIAAWNNALEIDADHAKAKEYIQRAKKLLDALKKR